MIYNISKATKADVPDLERLVNSAYRGESSRQGWTTEADLLDGTRITKDLLEEIIQKPNSIILKYEEADDLFGCVELKQDGKKLYLGMLTVDPSQQGKGIGKILLNESENQAQMLSCQAIYMTVISRRKELIDWYKRHGFNETGSRKPFLMPDERWGLPKLDLEFISLEKELII